MQSYGAAMQPAVKIFSSFYENVWFNISHLVTLNAEMWASSIAAWEYATVCKWIWTVCVTIKSLYIQVTRVTRCLSISQSRWPWYSSPWLLSWGSPLTRTTWASCLLWPTRHSVQSRWRRPWQLVRNTTLSFTEVVTAAKNALTSFLFPVLENIKIYFSLLSFGPLSFS